jgi:hypothetical protein
MVRRHPVIAIWGTFTVLAGPWVAAWAVGRLRQSARFHVTTGRLHP